MIRHLFIVQYNFKDPDESGRFDEELWMDETDYKFGFDADDQKGRDLALAAAQACLSWLKHEDENEEWKLPYRIAHRITSDEGI